MEKKKGLQTISYEEEIVSANWVLKKPEAGFPVTVKQLQRSVQWLIIDLRRDNPIVENRPGKIMIQGFLRRNGIYI